MRLVVIADVHANLPALEAVLAASQDERADATICLGDLVGYNAEPAACIELIGRACTNVVAGNHDRECMGEVRAGTHTGARRALSWTREQLAPSQVAYLAALPPLVRTEHFVAAHGSYLSDTYVSGYVTSTMLEKNLLAIAGREGWPRVALCGHTHMPMLGWTDGTTIVESSLSTPGAWPSSARAVIVNPGSVGQPRDGDPRASYAVLDLAARTVRVERVGYDVGRTAAAILRAGLPAEHARRLVEGR